MTIGAGIITMEKVPMGMSLALICIVVIALLILWNIQRDKDNQVDIKDLICRDGRIDEGKFMRFTAFVVSTWGFVYLIIDQRFSEWYFAGYIAAWAGNALLGNYLALRADNINGSSPPPNPPPPPAPSKPVL